MTLTLTPLHRITDLDSHNLVLQRLHTRRTGKHAGLAVWLTIGYHTSLESALQQALDALTRAAAPTDLPAALSSLSAARQAILAAISDLHPHPTRKVAS